MSSRALSKALAATMALGVLAVTSLLLSACPGELENPDAFKDGGGVGCDDVPNDLVGARCATANCHDATTAAQSLNLTPDDGLTGRIVGVQSTLCTGTMIVNPDAPEESSLYTKVLQANTCGLRMPASGQKLTAEQEQCLLDWITSL
jgi:hypothetical protein